MKVERWQIEYIDHHDQVIAIDERLYMEEHIAEEVAPYSLELYKPASLWRVKKVTRRV